MRLPQESDDKSQAVIVPLIGSLKTDRFVRIPWHRWELFGLSHGFLQGTNNNSINFHRNGARYGECVLLPRP